MYLKIDTTRQDEVILELKDQSKKIKDQIVKKRKKGSQVLLPSIVKILKKNKLELKDLIGIEVNPGPGSFTGTRVGVAVANALGFALKIPVNGKKGKIVIPKYAKSKFD